jgi:hypothetical protein
MSMRTRATRWTWLAALLCLSGCGKAKAPQYTATPVAGYPYPFGMDVKRLLGKAPWEATTPSCAVRYQAYQLENPPKGSLWSAYSQVLLTADSLGTLQGFSATRSFANDQEARARVLELLEEIRRRYGAQTDSTVRPKKIVLARVWQDRSGNVVGLYTTGFEVRVTAHSGRIRRDCPGVGNDSLPRR